MSEPFAHDDSASAVSKWDDLRPADFDAGYLVGDGAARAAYVNGLRDLADFLESRPEIPVPDTGETISLFAAGTAREQRAQVDYAGELLHGLVTDETARGGDLYAERRFGPVTYEMIAVGAGAEFRTGQDVRLAPAQAWEAEDEGLAVAGTVTGVERQDDGTFAYTVHFPGAAGIRHGLAADALEETESPAIRLDDGSAFTIKEAERLLIEAVAGGDRRPGPIGPDANELFKGLSEACEVRTPLLFRQLSPKVVQRERELRGKTPSPAALAANDNPGPFDAPRMPVEFAGSGHVTARSAQQSRRDGPRP